jgi:hypothetical protein
VAESRMSQRQWEAFFDKLIRTARRARALADAPTPEAPERLAIHEQICAVADRDGISYSEAFDRVLDGATPPGDEVVLELPTPELDPDRLALDQRVIAFADTHQIPYPDALARLLGEH